VNTRIRVDEYQEDGTLVIPAELAGINRTRTSR
jgi:hypothetical protein